MRGKREGFRSTNYFERIIYQKIHQFLEYILLKLVHYGNITKKLIIFCSKYEELITEIQDPHLNDTAKQVAVVVHIIHKRNDIFLKSVIHNIHTQ